jgi:hypothetical protein
MKGEWKRRSENGAAVVFVRGALSSGDASWQNPNGTYWPSLLENEPSMEKIGIYVFTFRMSIFSRANRLGDVVDALKEHIRVDGVFDCHKLVFVARSIGGLVVRKLLDERVTDFKDKHISVGLFLVASPSLGPRYANIIKPLARFLGHSKADALRFSENNAWLMDLDNEFTNLKEAKTIRLVDHELVAGLIRTQVVEPFSGAKCFGESLTVPGGDHFSIAKPDSSQAIQHQLLLRFIAEMPTHEGGGLPLEEELRERLEVRLRACKEGDVPFRTFHKLAALLAMRSGFAWNCFEAAGQGTAGRIERWLREVILAQAKNERGQGAPIGSLDADLSIASAALIARKERASQIDQRHLLLALLADKNTGTMSEIAKSLSATSRESLQAAAETGRPRELHPVPHVRSAVPPLTREEK